MPKCIFSVLPSLLQFLDTIVLLLEDLNITGCTECRNTLQILLWQSEGCSRFTLVQCSCMENYVLNYMYLKFSFLLQDVGSFRRITESGKLCMFCKIIKYNYVCDKKELLLLEVWGFVFFFFIHISFFFCLQQKHTS